MPGPNLPARRAPALAARLLTVVALALALSAPAPAGPTTVEHRPSVARGLQGMVVTPDAHATQIGLDVLRRGGTATDAAVAVALTLAVTYPIAGNLGGGGFLLHRDPSAVHHALDFRERAPARLRAAAFLDEEGRPIPGLSLDGGLAVGVPGSVAGLAAAHRRWGRLEWAELVEPARALAEDGFVVSPFLAAAFERAGESLLADPHARRIFAADGELPRAGERLVQRDLARTLERLAQRGPRGFYHGPVARELARSVRAAGGVMRRSDLARYRVAWREPVESIYRGHRVVSFPPPSSGGVALLQMLGMLELRAGPDFGPPSATLIHHLMAEVERRAFADRSRWMGDPDYTPVPARGLLDPAYLASRAASIDPRRATPSSRLQPGDPATTSGDGETLHFSIADVVGNAVAVTTTLNRWFGSGLVAGGTGVLLNNEIDDFALAPGVPNLYGLLGSEANAVHGGKRPLSSMTPTIVEAPGPPTNRPLLVLGSPGGSTIITTVLQVLVNVVDRDMPLADAVAAPRLHHQWQPDAIRHERGALSAQERAGLERLGHELSESARSIGNVNAIGVSAHGVWVGVADGRRDGSAAGY